MKKQLVFELDSSLGAISSEIEMLKSISKDFFEITDELTDSFYTTASGGKSMSATQFDKLMRLAQLMQYSTRELNRSFQVTNAINAQLFEQEVRNKRKMQMIVTKKEEGHDPQ